MRHKVAGRKLGRKTAHRWATFRSLVTALVTHERIETTLSKAKELRHFADRVITIGKQNDLAARREIFDFTRSRDVVEKVVDQLAPRFSDRHGGYTRIMKLGFRAGDSAPMAIIEYIPGELKDVSKAEKK